MTPHLCPYHIQSSANLSCPEMVLLCWLWELTKEPAGVLRTCATGRDSWVMCLQFNKHTTPVVDIAPPPPSPSQMTPATTSTTPIRQLLRAADAQTAHPATSSTAPAHQPLCFANAETTPAGAPVAATDRKQRPDATCDE